MGSDVKQQWENVKKGVNHQILKSSLRAVPERNSQLQKATL